MGRYLIVDPEVRSVEQITESMRGIDPQAQFETFADFSLLNDHIKTLTVETAPAFWTFDLVIFEYLSLPHSEWAEKLAAIKKSNSKELSVVLVGHENAHTTAKFIRPLDMYNFIFKPFDELILKESLNLAVKVKKKAQPLEMKSQSATAFIALLKDVELQSISELGFVTFSDVQIDVGSSAKYFSPLFLYGKKQSAWAQCLISLPHPQKPGTFINKFQFYAADHIFLNHLRRYIQAHKQDQTSSALWNLLPPKVETPLKLGLIAIEGDEATQITQDLESHFPNLKVELIKLDPQKKSGDSGFTHDIVLNMSEIKFENFKDSFKPDAKFFWLTPPILNEDELKEHAKNYHDVFVKPLDRGFFFKKLKVHASALKEAEPSVLINITTHEKMKAASKVKISEISELYVNLVYSRELPYKEFREFVFLGEDETQVVELPAFCHYTEKNQSGDPKDGVSFLHQFVFFGMTDHLLKQIRLWLLHNYIVQNQKNE